MHCTIFYDKNPGFLKKMEKSIESVIGSANTVPLSNVSLFSGNGNSKVLIKEKILKKTDCIFILSNVYTPDFLEPLISIFDEKGVYSPYKQNSFYINSNEALAFSVLSSFGFKIPETVFFGRVKSIKSSLQEFSFPLLFKTFSKKRVTQKILVESPRSLKWVLKSKLPFTDLIEIREFIESDLIHCNIIGDKVYAVRRRLKEGEFVSLKKGKFVKLSREEKETAILALKAVGLNVGTVKFCQNKIIKVKPEIRFQDFSKKSGENLFLELAKHFNKKRD